MMDNLELLRLADRKFEKEEGWQEGYWVEVNFKTQTIRVYHRFFPLPKLANNGVHNYIITLKITRAWIEYVYNGYGWDEPFYAHKLIKVDKEDIAKILQEARNAKELYEKVKELYTLYVGPYYRGYEG